MAICQATYDSLEAIPEALRGEFENKNGKWVIKADAVPGAAEVLNPGLAANRDRALDQYTREQQRATKLEGDLAQAQSELNNMRAPGSRILGSDDAKAYDGYVALGSVKDVKKIVDEHPKLVAQVEGVKLEGSLQKIAEEAGINFEVLKDWAKMDSAKNLEFFTKEVEIDNPDKAGEKIKVKQLAAKRSDEVNGKTEITEVSFDDLASALPSYMKDALTKTETGDESDKGKSAIQQGKGVRIPNLSSTQNTTTAKDTDKRPVDQFNKEREAKVNPLMPAASKAAGNE